MQISDYDLVVIGSGPAGQKAAIAAAKARKRVAMIDRAVMIGGVSVHTGTIPSKTVREATSAYRFCRKGPGRQRVSKSCRHFCPRCLLPCERHCRARD